MKHILWRKTLRTKCKVIDLHDKRLMGIEMCNDHNSKLLMLNVHLPTLCDDVNWVDFSHYLGKIDTIMSCLRIL